MAVSGSPRIMQSSAEVALRLLLSCRRCSMMHIMIVAVLLCNLLMRPSVTASTDTQSSGTLPPCRGDVCTNTTAHTGTTSNKQCVIPNSSPLQIGESLYRTNQIMRGTEALDLCLVVSTTSSMSDSHLWLQIAVPILDGHLLTLGIGNGALQNRYCLVAFGGNSATRFILVNGEIFLRYNQFFQARRQLVTTPSTVSDGYEAINFTLSNAPFRDHPNVAKVIVLVTNSDRVTSGASTLTREYILQSLFSRNIVLDTVVSISLQLPNQRESTVLGYHGYSKSSVLKSDGGYAMSTNQSVHITYAMGETIANYVAVSLALNGSSWPLGLLDNQDYNTILSFSNAFTNAHRLMPALPVTVCEKCSCTEESSLSCHQHLDQVLCRCLVNQTLSECVPSAPTPTPTPTSYFTSYLAPTSTPEPVAMEMSGQVTTTNQGETVVMFSSNHRQASYQCILLPDRVENPLIQSCTSPHRITTPTPGRYSILVLGSHGNQQVSLLLWFEVQPSSGRLDVSIIQRSIAANASVLVTFAANRLDVEFDCSTGDSPFQRCTSPYRIPPIAPGIREDVFIVLATDSNGKAAASVLKIDDPTLSPPTTQAPGPVMIEVWAKLPDLQGVLKVCFRPTRRDVTCICQIDSLGPGILCFNRTSGRGEYSASPDELGTGPHSLKVTCMDDDAYSTSETIKFNLAEPPLAPPPTESLHCNLSLTGPNGSGILTAVHNCTRPVTSLCQVSRLAAVNCSNRFEFDTSPLGPGTHAFVLVSEDGFGESVMKVFPFFIETAQRRCCPEIVTNSTTLSVERDLLVHLYLSVRPGNCSLNEGFSYSINWGDTASESGTKTHLTNLRTSRQYSVAGEYNINAVYCNNPASSRDICCSFALLTADLNSSQQQQQT